MKNIREDSIEILGRICMYTKQDICKALSLALDIPELFDISDKRLYTLLREYEATQSYMEGASYYDEEDDY